MGNANWIWCLKIEINFTKKDIMLEKDVMGGSEREAECENECRILSRNIVCMYETFKK